jgi:hypothetical protein
MENSCLVCQRSSRLVTDVDVKVEALTKLQLEFESGKEVRLILDHNVTMKQSVLT